MREVLAGAASAAALLMTAAAPAAAAPPEGVEPNERACENGHGTLVAHGTVPHRTAGNEQAHQSIPHFCHPS